MKVYFDVCCLNRLFDDQTQNKIRLETEAIVSMLKWCKDSSWILIGSDIIALEISKNKDPIKMQKVTLLHEGATMQVKYNAHIKQRAEDFRNSGVKLFDSLHMASAEYAQADMFFTVDKQLLNASTRTDIKINVVNPLNFYMEVLNDE